MDATQEKFKFERNPSSVINITSHSVYVLSLLKVLFNCYIKNSEITNLSYSDGTNFDTLSQKKLGKSLDDKSSNSINNLITKKLIQRMINLL